MYIKIFEIIFEKSLSLNRLLSREDEKKSKQLDQNKSRIKKWESKSLGHAETKDSSESSENNEICRKVCIWWILNSIIFNILLW